MGAGPLNNGEIIEKAIGILANTMRMYVEVHMRFGELSKVDPEEAIDNIDRAFEMKLEAFHTLYDVSKSCFPYFDHGDTAILILVRNAIHHRDHPLFQSLNRRLHLEEGIERWLGASFLLAYHPALHESPLRMSHPVRLDDVDSRLDASLGSPYLDKSVGGAGAARRLDVVNAQLGLPAIREHALQNGYPADQTYLDLMPIFVSAVSKVFREMKAAGLRFRGFDAETYRIPFTTEVEVDLGNPMFRRLRLRGRGSLDFVPD